MPKLILFIALIFAILSCNKKESYLLRSADRQHCTNYCVEKDTLVEVYKRRKSGKNVRAFYRLNKKIVRYKDYYYHKAETCIEVKEKIFRAEHDTVTCFYPDSTLKAIFPLWHSRMHGRVLSFTPKGKPLCFCNYNRGKRDGLQLFYWGNGQLQAKVMYAMDKPMTILHSYDLQGQDLDSGTLKDGYGTWKEFDDNGKLVEMTTYEKGKKVKRVKY